MGNNPGRLIDPNGTIVKEALEDMSNVELAEANRANWLGSGSSLAYKIIGGVLKNFGLNGWIINLNLEGRGTNIRNVIVVEFF